MFRVTRHVLSAPEVITASDIKESGLEGIKLYADGGVNYDLMFIKFILLHEGGNSNGDYVTRDEMESSFWSWVNKPITWEHGEPYIGFITDSMLIKPSETGPDPRWYIECAAVIWKYKYPRYASDIIDGLNHGTYRMSTETYFKEALYTVGEDFNEVYTADEAPYLVDLVGRTYKGERVYRVLINIHGSGAGVVAEPADKDAIILDVVAKKTISNDVKHTFIDYKQAVAHSTVKQLDTEKEDERKMDELKKELDKLKTELASKVEEITSLEGEVEKYKVKLGESEASAKSTKETIDELNKKIKELESEKEALSSERDTLSSDFSKFKEEVEAEREAIRVERLIKERVEELTEAGVVINDENRESIEEQLKLMEDTVYASFKKLLISSIPDNKDVSSINQSHASKQTFAPNFEDSNEDTKDLRDEYASMWDAVFTSERLGSELE